MLITFISYPAHQSIIITESHAKHCVHALLPLSATFFLSPVSTAGYWLLGFDLFFGILQATVQLETVLALQRSLHSVLASQRIHRSDRVWIGR